MMSCPFSFHEGFTAFITLFSWGRASECRDCRWILTKPRFRHHRQVDATHRTLLERTVRHDRAVLAVMLAAVSLACWSWIVPMARDMYSSMSGPSAWMMTDVWDAPHLLLLGAMWFVMMAGMMLPSATPT